MPDAPAVVPVAVPVAPPTPPTYPPTVAPVPNTTSPITNFLSYAQHAWQHYGVLLVGAILVEEAHAYLAGSLATLGNAETVAVTAVAGFILATFQKPLNAIAQ